MDEGEEVTKLEKDVSCKLPEDAITIEMDDVAFCLEAARTHKLETEVVCWALKYMKEHPDLSISEAINMGLNEWVK